MSSLSGIPSSRLLVRRVRHTRSQTKVTDAASRRRNLCSPYTVQACAKFGTITRIAIVDDVMSTGATVDALAQSLKEHGVWHKSMCGVWPEQACNGIDQHLDRHAACFSEPSA